MMNDGAIDFRKLLKEEKKKARQKHKQQQQQKDQSLLKQSEESNQDKEVKTQQEEKTDKTTSTLIDYHKIREEDVEAIDFDKLKEKLRQEQKLAESWCIPSVFDRTKHLVCCNPSNIYFLPDFLARPQDQQSLLEWLQSSLPENPYESSSTQSDPSQANGSWTRMKYAKRRVAMFDAQIQPQFPSPLQRICNALVEQGIFDSQIPPNHILINEYHPGQGILPHTDGPAYYSRTATLSLGSDVLIQFTPRPNHHHTALATTTTNNNTNTNDADAANAEQQQQQQQQLWLPKGCLLVFEDSAYLDYCHGINDRVLEEQVSEECLNGTPGNTILRGYRISLTFRHKKHSKSTA